MDKFDQHIVALLVANARMAVAAIAREVNLSRSAVSERIRNLEQKGVIRGYHARLGAAPAQMRAYMELHYLVHRCEQHAARLRNIPEVRQAFTISGDTDIMLYVEAATMARLEEVRSHIERLPDIKTVKTHIILSELIHNPG